MDKTLRPFELNNIEFSYVNITCQPSLLPFLRSAFSKSLGVKTNSIHITTRQINFCLIKNPWRFFFYSMIKNLNKHQQIFIFVHGINWWPQNPQFFALWNVDRNWTQSLHLRALYRENLTKERKSSFYADHNSLSCITAYQNKQEGLRGTKTTPRFIEAFSCDKRKLKIFWKEKLYGPSP